MGHRPCVYKNVSIAMFSSGVTINDLAEQTHIGYKALWRKLNGTTAVTVEEAIWIHEALGKPVPLETLFSRE